MTQVNIQEFYQTVERIVAEVVHKEIPKAMLQATSDFMTAEEVGLRLKFHPSWVYRRIHAKRNPIPHHMIDGSIRFRWSEVEEWATRRKGLNGS